MESEITDCPFCRDTYPDDKPAPSVEVKPETIKKACDKHRKLIEKALDVDLESI